MNGRAIHRTLLVSSCVALLAACGGDSSTTVSTTPSGQDSLVFEPASSLTIKQGSIQQVHLALNSAGATGSTSAHTVRVSTTDPNVAEVLPDTCTLSNASAQSRRCLLTVRGKTNGTTALAATADGIAAIQIPTAVGTSTNYGQLTVESSSGTFVPGPLALTFPIGSTGPYTLRVNAHISGSSGVDTADNVVIRFTGAVGVTFNPAQCTVTSQTSGCSTVATMATAASTNIAVSASGAKYAGYSDVSINAAPAAATNNGSIVISTQPGNNVPKGMNAPLFVNWINPVANDTVSVTLTLAGQGISFYQYAPGNNIKPTLSQTGTCSLSYVGPGNASNVMNCGLGLTGSASSGTVTVGATAISSTGKSYSLGALVLGAVAPAAPVRTVTFTNNSSETIYVGITGGAAAAYLDDTTPALPPGQTTANLKPGAASLCGPSNPQAACPLGTTCTQGGASPSSTLGNTPYYCYYDALTPSNGYAIVKGGKPTEISVSGSSIAPNGVIWSGNFYPRTGCDPATGVCDNATCRGAANGLVCGPGTGPSPGINTLAELTFQTAAQPDFYDVSIINGANFATEFGPTNVPISTASAYQCGTAGSRSAQNGGYTAGGSGLPAAPWTMSPDAKSFPTGALTTGDASSYYRIVIPTTTPAASCTVHTDCTDATNNTCGFAMSDVMKGGFAFATRSCGRPVAWISANSIWGANQTSNNAAPFGFTTNWPNGLTGTVSVGDLQLCINQTYSAYIQNGTASSPVQPVALACGGVMWGDTQSTLPIGNPVTNVGLGITNPSTPAFTANANWLNYVLPTIQWMKKACPTCYTYPFDDMTSTFVCTNSGASARTDYGVTFSDLK